MRSPFALLVLLGAATLARTQEPVASPTGEPVPRFGVLPRVKTYAQDTPRKALASVIEAAEKNEFPYLVAHLLDPAFVDTRLTERAKQFEGDVAAEFARLRDAQQKNPGAVSADARIPVEPAQFRAAVTAETRARAFKQLVRDVQDKLTDDPEAIKELRRFFRQGAFSDGDAAVRVGLPDVKDRAVFLRKVGDRWFVENRQVDDKAPDPKKDAGDAKKDPGK